MKKTIIILTLLLCISTVCADVTIQNPTITIDLVAGSSITRNITFRYTGGSTQSLILETTITPDGDGIEVTYSDIPTTVSPNTDYTIKMTIEASFYLKPGVYVIVTNITTTGTPSSGRGPTQRATVIIPHGDSGVEYYPTPPPDDAYNPPQPTSQEEGFDWFAFILIMLIGIILTLLTLFLRRRKTKRGNT